MSDELFQLLIGAVPLSRGVTAFSRSFTAWVNRGCAALNVRYWYYLRWFEPGGV
ncbi:MAG TPA: hypothetical protein VGS19_38940 [Streptosporangiaceae bacterium]|nr:hypothetical protein [Streptosporangiaceae bacterium]